MKTTTNVIERLCLFLFALVLAAPAWAQGGAGNESETITIASKADWKTFCKRVNNGEPTLNAKMTADVDLGSDINMVGDYSNDYTGTFDGQGHTLSFDWDAGSMIGIAPFKRVVHATIKNLRTQGQITTSRHDLSGLVFSAGRSTISRCVSDVKLTGEIMRSPSKRRA